MFFKICGMRRQEDLDIAAECGAALCGFIFHPTSPRYISPEAAARLDSRGMLRTGVFVLQEAKEILKISKKAHLDLIQLHGGQDNACADTVGKDRVLRVLWPERFQRACTLQDALERVAAHSACILLDAGLSNGGNGRPIDTNLLTKIHIPKPWILAGGLGLGCLATLASLPKSSLPDGLDFNSGLEDAPGVKNSARLRALLGELSMKFPVGNFPITLQKK